MKTYLNKYPLLHFAILFSAIFIAQLTFAQERNNSSCVEVISNKKLAAKTNLLLPENNAATHSFLIYPASAKSSVVIYIESDAKKATDMIVIDENGRIIKQKNISFFEGPNNFLEDKFGNQQSGNYGVTTKGDIYSSYC